MAFDLSTPINTALLLYIIYTVQRILFPSTSLPDTPPTEFKSGYSWMPKAHPPSLLFKTYTPKTLQEFNGEEGKRILLAIKGVVYDVTAGRNFYGPNGMYANFAGRDASRGMAKQSFDEGQSPRNTLTVLRSADTSIITIEMLTSVDKPLDTLLDLTQEEIDNMKGWMDHFSSKYIICGKLVENDAV